jgi:hypothetical protein
LRPEAEGVVAAFTTRIDGVSRAPFDTLNLSFAVGDDEADVRRNRHIAAETIGLQARWSVVRQLHGAQVAAAAEPGVIPDADGIWTDDTERTLAVLAADCVPVLVVGAGRLGLAHAGWRGLRDGIVENTVRTIAGEPAVFAGPAIGPCCFEVGGDVAEAFSTRFGKATVRDGRYVDLWAATEISALGAGAETFAAARVCTSCHRDLFFSHRRDHGRTGRQALIARLADG